MERQNAFRIFGVKLDFAILGRLLVALGSFAIAQISSIMTKKA